jgi:chromosome segregation ATPase
MKHQLENVSLSKDCGHYIKEIEDLLSKSNTVVHISVENEKLKNSNNDLNSKLMKESHKIDLLKNDIKSLNDHNNSNEDIICQLNSEMSENNLKIREFVQNISDLQEEQNVKTLIISDLEINLENKINIIKGLDQSLTRESLLRESAEKSYNMTQSLYNEVLFTFIYYSLNYLN